MKARGGVALPTLYTALILMAALGVCRCASAYGQYQLSRQKYETSRTYYALDERAERFRIEVGNHVSDIPLLEAEADAILEILHTLLADYPFVQIEPSSDSKAGFATISTLFEADGIQLYVQLGIQTDGSVTVLAWQLL